jgi:hypothetical protein
LLTNLFKVDFKEALKVYIYSLKTLPEIPAENGKKLRALLCSNRLVVERAVGAHVVCGRTVWGTRGQGGKEEVRVSVEHEAVPYQLQLRVAKQITLSDIYLPQKEHSAVVFAFLNNLVRNFFHHMHYTEIGRTRKYFDPQSRRDLSGASLSLFSGYSTSFSLLEGGLFLKVDPTVKIVQSESALDLINRVYKLNSSLSRAEKRLLVEQELVGKTVMANYGKNRCYRISALSFDTSLDTFQFTHRGTTTSLLDYYRHTYDLIITSKKQPLLQALSNRSSQAPENQETVFLIPELVLMGGLPEDFDERKRREVSERTIVNPGVKL